MSYLAPYVGRYDEAMRLVAVAENNHEISIDEAIDHVGYQLVKTHDFLQQTLRNPTLSMGKKNLVILDVALCAFPDFFDDPQTGDTVVAVSATGKVVDWNVFYHDMRTYTGDCH